MIANPCMELGSEDRQCRCTDDDLVHIVVFFDSSNEWLRNCDFAFLAPVQVDVSEELTITCLWCCIARSDRSVTNTWL